MLTITGTVNSGYGGWTITNTADITRMNRPDTNETDNTASAAFTIEQADLAVLKSVSPTSAEEGNSVDFTITLRNNGPADATGIEVTDLLPSGLGYVSSAPSQGSYAGGTGIWSVGGVTNGGMATLVITATTLAGSGGATITNTAEITASSHDDPILTNNTASAELPVLGTDLGLGKWVIPAAAAEGQEVMFTVAVTNLGPTNTAGIVVSEPLMAGVTYVSNRVSQGSYASGTGEWTVGALDVNDVATLSIWATVDAGTVGTMLTNTATITTNDLPDPNPANDTDSAILEVSSIRLDKTSDVSVSVEPGGIITYTMIITNYGSVTHSNVTLTDWVPDGTAFVPGSVTAIRYPEAPPVATTLIYDATGSFTPPAGVTSVTVSAWGGGGGGGRETGRSSTGGGGAGGAFAMISNYAVTPGSNYTVTVGGGGAGGSTAGINGSDGEASWFDTVTTVYAEGGAGGTGTAVNNANGAGGTGSAASSIGDVVYRGGNGAQGNTSASGAGGGGAGTTGAGGDASTGTGGAGTTLYGGDGADGVGDNSDGADGSACGGGGSGGNASYRDDHDGGDGAQGRVTVAYELPAQVPGTTDDPPNLAADWNLNPGQALEVTFQVRVDDPLELMAITNTASVTSSIQTIPLTDTVIDPLIPVDVGVGKAASSDWVEEGDPVSFSIAVTNFSPLITATGVELTDLLPAGFNYVSNTVSQGTYASGSGVWTVGSLSPLATATMQIYSTAVTNSGGLIWTNTVTISALDQTDTNALNDVSSAAVGVRGADLAIVKTADPGTPQEGDTVLYTIVVTNNGPSDTTGVSVSEPLTNGVTYVSNAVSQGSYTPGSGTWVIGDLNVGESATLWLTATVDAGTMGTAITNRSRIIQSDMPDPVSANDQDSAVIYISALMVSKISDVAGYAVPGSNITYTMIVSNSGASAYSNVVVTDYAPSGTTYVAGSLSVTGPNTTSSYVLDEFNAQAYTNNNGTMDWNDDWQENDPYGTAGPVGDYVGVTTGGGQLFITYAYVGDEMAWRSADLSGFDRAVLRYDWEAANLDGSETMTVSVSTNGEDPFVPVGTYNGTDSGSAEIDITAFMSTGTTVRLENDSVNWSSGDYGYLDNVEMEAFRTVTNTVVGGDLPILASNRTLHPGEYLTLTFDVAVDNPCGVTQIVNTVSVTSDQIPTNITATASDPVAYTDLALTKSVDDSFVREGDSVVYTILITNRGPVVATGLQVSEPLTNGLTYVTGSASQGSYDGGTGIWNVGSLAVGSVAVLTITADVDAGTAGTVITNLSRISAMDQADPTPEDNEDTAEVTVEGVDVGVGKSVVPTVPVEKEQLVYTISVTNFGPDTATGVEVTDLLPAGLTYVSGISSQGAYDDSTGIWTIGTLIRAQVETLAITAQVGTNTSGTVITNTATRTATDQVDTNALNDSASVEVSPTQAPLDIFKSVSPTGSVEAGDTLTYTIVVTNRSSLDQTGVDVTDSLPPDVAYVTGSVAVVGWVTTNGNVLDAFGARYYSNNDGTENWATDWVESEGDGPTAGNVQILFDSVRGSTFTLRMAGASQTMAREADLSGKSGAVLSFIWRRDGLEAGEYVAVEMSSNGTAGTWTEVGRFSGAATDAAYSNFSYDVDAWASSNTAVRFVTPAGQDTSDILWVDDVQFVVEERMEASLTGGSPPDLATNLTLLSGESATLTFDVTVDAGVAVTQLVNSASVTSDQMTTPRTDSATSPVEIDWASVGGILWFDVNGDGIRQPTETNRFANIPVALMDTNGSVVATLNSDANGEYLFENVLPGTYTVRFDLSAMSTNIGVVIAHAGSDPALDSDVTSGNTGGYGWTDEFTLMPGETLSTINLGLARKGSTRAELNEVWGEWSDGEARVVWQTGSEWGTAGFFIYRIDPETGEEIRLNHLLIPSEFTGSGARYAWADPSAVEQGKGIYRLEEIELAGNVMNLGTHEVSFGTPRAENPSSCSPACRKKRSGDAEPRSTSRSVFPSAALKVTYRAEGLYGVDMQSIADGMGVSLENILQWQADGMLSFRSCGCPIPVHADFNRQRLVFYGNSIHNWYARDAVVLITHDKAVGMSCREPGSCEGETVFPVDMRFEEDCYPFDSAVTLPEDFYYWDYVISGHATLGSRDFPLDMSGFAGGDAELQVRLMGWSNTAQDPDHLAEFLFNGTAVGSATFDGQDQIEVGLTVPEDLIIDGTNTLTVKGVLQEGHTHSYFVVDRIDAAFDRVLTPMSRTSVFRAGSASDVSAEAFSEPLAVALDEEGTPVWIADESGGLTDKAWAIAVENERFAVAEADDLPMLEVESAAKDAWFMSSSNRIDYLVITSEALEETARELAEYRSGQGLRTGVATFEDICDLMTDGLRTPESIPALLAYAQLCWAEAPWMVVLAGNGHYDYFNAASSEVNHVPPMLLQTRDGIFAADGLLTDIDGDLLPDFALGRLPALTADDLAAMIEKIKNYESCFGQDWQSTLVLAADAADPLAGDFSGVNDALEALTDGKYPVDRIDLDATGIAAARKQLMSSYQGGAGFVHYTGHGGVNNLSAQGLLTASDVASMDNSDRPPVTVALSCLVGRYEAPGLDSMGELLMRQLDGGAVAVWGPSGLSRNAPAAELGEAFYRTVLEEGSGTLGLAVLQAQRGLSRDVFSEDTLAVYNLLGDPALRIAGNTRGHSSDASFAQWRWEHFTPEELADPEIGGDTDGNFFEYAMEGDQPVEAELPEFGYAKPDDQEDGAGFILRWKRRIHREDIDYSLYLSDNLKDWESTPSDLETVGVEADADGVMETVRTRINRPDMSRVFVGIKALRK